MYEFHNSPSSRLPISKVLSASALVTVSIFPFRKPRNQPVLKPSSKVKVDAVIEMTGTKKLLQRVERVLACAVILVDGAAIVHLIRREGMTWIRVHVLSMAMIVVGSI